MSNPGARRNVASGPLATAIAGTGAVFTGVSPRIEVLGLHYEVTPADLKVGFSYCFQMRAELKMADYLFAGWNTRSGANYPCKRLSPQPPIRLYRSNCLRNLRLMEVLVWMDMMYWNWLKSVAYAPPSSSCLCVS